MDDNERESIVNKIAEMEAAIEACTKNVDDGRAKANAFIAKRARLKKELTALNRRLKE